MCYLFEHILQDAKVSAYIANVDNEPVGYMLLSEMNREENWFRHSYSVLYIDQICIDGENKGKGIGKALVNYAKEYAKERKIQRLEMDYWTQNSNSGEFFRNQGFHNYNERLYFEIE